jgi:hypothetical protein
VDTLYWSVLSNGMILGIKMEKLARTSIMNHIHTNVIIGARCYLEVRRITLDTIRIANTQTDHGWTEEELFIQEDLDLLYDFSKLHVPDVEFVQAA